MQHTETKEEDVIVMAMPLNITLVRHGESWLNWALAQCHKGNELPENLIGQPGWQVRLTDWGRTQADRVGLALRLETDVVYDAGYCSPYIRTIETASLILPEAHERFWRIFPQIRERDWGDWECVPSMGEYVSRKDKLSRARSIERMNWSPPGGESGNDAILRVRDMIGTITRSEAENVILSCHGELIEFILRMFNDWGTLHDWEENEERWGYLLYPVNCQVIQLSRQNPESGEIGDYLHWVRSFVPWDFDHPNNRGWTTMERKRYSGVDLSQILATYPANY